MDPNRNAPSSEDLRLGPPLKQKYRGTVRFVITCQMEYYDIDEAAALTEKMMKYLLHTRLFEDSKKKTKAKIINVSPKQEIP